MNGRDEEKGLVWKLPSVKSKQLGKIGPAFGLGVGCGFGLGIGLIGGTGFGPGLPGLQLGFGFGAGCGIGLGFGYAVGRGFAYDDIRRYSNVGKLASFPNQDEVGELLDELVVNTKKLIKATTQELDKWRRS
ncbi:hypothetical protein K7X08_028934 [Anisodus acutangulus]|uniref:Uncharacterized protein n=2 Tax=Anisodus TaxID=243963 RepID=A0A9Q1QTA2_9SOLA|nr:hypothetical protein K7X08_028934 [Anisodus acutangulus]KAK4337865.1 hypothetical protein RND71_042352 [Anisodus tanguticus]